MKEQLLRLFQLVALRGAPITPELREPLEQVLGIICQRSVREALPQLACDILEHMHWEHPGAKALFSDEGVWAIVPQRNGTEAFIEAMHWQDHLGTSYAGLSLGILPNRFVFSRIHEADAIALVRELVNPPSSPNIVRFRLFGGDDLDSSLPHD